MWQRYAHAEPAVFAPIRVVASGASAKNWKPKLETRASVA